MVQSALFGTASASPLFTIRGKEGDRVVAAGVPLQTIVLGEPLLRIWAQRATTGLT
jgi:hypothetical protein